LIRLEYSYLIQFYGLIHNSIQGKHDNRKVIFNLENTYQSREEPPSIAAFN